MAEVRRRLLCEMLTPARGSVAALCVFPMTSEQVTNDAKEPSIRLMRCVTETVECSSNGLWSGVHRKEKPVWSSVVLKSQQLLVGPHLMNGRPGSRCFSQGANARAFFHSKGTHHRTNNGGQDVPPLYRSRTAYYDILGVSGSATHSQIKTAYYKQSFRYHPDRNSGSEDAANRFSEISEAYMVLGSVNLRKKYDRGILSWEDVRTAGKPNAKGDNPTSKVSERGASSGTSSRSPTKPMFDFDAFYQAHYGEQLEREKFFKERREQFQKRKKESHFRWPFQKLSEMSAMMLVLSAILLLVSMK